LTWGTVIQFERLIASTFGRDRIWFAGDAAHSTGPLGFQSLNRGFAEAYELASSLATFARENVRDSDLLRRYDASQQAEWRRLLGIATPVASDGALTVAEGSRLVPCLPVTGADLDGVMMQLGLRFA
jgi:2-polyprenyl-6-methoxyphenol hydroxylase-like FAD-dependent oxidoreductase